MLRDRAAAATRARKKHDGFALHHLGALLTDHDAGRLLFRSLDVSECLRTKQEQFAYAGTPVLRTAVVGLIALGVFAALLLMNPVALAALALAAATGRFGVGFQVASGSGVLVLAAVVAAAFLWRPAPPPPAKRKGKASRAGPARRRTRATAASPGARGRKRTTA